MRKIFLLSFMVFFANCTNGFALEKVTHRKINEFNAPIINQQLANIGFGGGAADYVNGQPIFKWIGDGGEAEDEPLYSRSFNHYLNPINNTGYGGVFKSALEWSHSQGEFGSTFGGDYAWPAVRSYYLNALISPDKATRDNYFAETFRGVGQLMHLVEDMSVPAHTRNDGHVLYNYEDWVEGHSGVVDSGAATPAYFPGAMSTYDPLFLDLAAFSNANFLSNGTIFSDFTYPRIEDTELWTDTTNNRDYLRKLALSTGVQVEHLAASSWLYFYRLRYFPADNTLLPLGLDDMCYSDYAALLIPRAVGYSASLINYFFRGQIDMKKNTQNAGKYVIENLSSETMSGTFSLYYDDASGNRKLVQGADLSVANNVSIAPGASSASIPPFTEPTDAKTKGKYILVFQGDLGAEKEAVVGKVVTIEVEKSFKVIVRNKYNGEVKTSGVSFWLRSAKGQNIWSSYFDYAYRDGYWVITFNDRYFKRYGDYDPDGYWLNAVISYGLGTQYPGVYKQKDLRKPEHLIKPRFEPYTMDAHYFKVTYKYVWESYPWNPNSTWIFNPFDMRSSDNVVYWGLLNGVPIKESVVVESSVEYSVWYGIGFNRLYASDGYSMETDSGPLRGGFDNYNDNYSWSRTAYFPAGGGYHYVSITAKNKLCIPPATPFDSNCSMTLVPWVVVKNNWWWLVKDWDSGQKYLDPLSINAQVNSW